jgi:type 1 glutamine amidotransferase
MEMGNAPVESILTTASEHGTQPGGWVRHEGSGRVAVLTPGHNVEVWLYPAYQTLIGNALRWCAGEE